MFEWDGCWEWDISDLGSGMSSDRHADICLVGVLCGSFVYENPILGSCFKIIVCEDWTTLVFGDFLRVGALGVESLTSVCICSYKQVDAMVGLSIT